MIYVLGSNPSEASGSLEPFVGTRSWATLQRWLEDLGVEEYALLNVFPNTTPKNRALTNAEIIEGVCSQGLQYLLRGEIVLALGVSAGKAVHLCHESLPVFLPHPSGLNRVLNDKTAVARMLAAARLHILELSQLTGR